MLIHITLMSTKVTKVTNYFQSQVYYPKHYIAHTIHPQDDVQSTISNVTKTVHTTDVHSNMQCNVKSLSYT